MLRRLTESEGEILSKKYLPYLNFTKETDYSSFVTDIYEEKMGQQWTFAANPNLTEDLDEIYESDESQSSSSAINED